MISFYKKVYNLINKPLSDDDVLKICNYKANLMTYPELVEYDNIDDALGKHKALILLYETKKNMAIGVVYIETIISYIFLIHMVFLLMNN